jgi:hypothetical protein
MPADSKRIPKPRRPIPRNPSGYPGEMKAIGESISGTQPEIGEKDTGVGRRQRPPVPKRRPRSSRRPA